MYIAFCWSSLVYISNFKYNSTDWFSICHIPCPISICMTHNNTEANITELNIFMILELNIVTTQFAVAFLTQTFNKSVIWVSLYIHICNVLRLVYRKLQPVVQGRKTTRNKLRWAFENMVFFIAYDAKYSKVSMCCSDNTSSKWNSEFALLLRVEFTRTT